MNKIILEYILQNTQEVFEETPFGQIVADEVNYVVNNMPEIQLARNVLDEGAFEDLATDAARQVMELVKTQLRDAVPNLVAQMAEKIQGDARKEIEKATSSIQQMTDAETEETQDFSA